MNLDNVFVTKGFILSLLKNSLLIKQNMEFSIFLHVHKEGGNIFISLYDLINF